MMKRYFIYLTLLVTVVVVTSCSSTKKLSKSVSVGNLTQKEYIDKIIDNGNMYDAVSAKSVFTLSLGNKEPLSVGGSLKIKKGKAIMLSATPLLGIEVARMEITPSGVLVIDRMKKRYVKVTFGELNAYLNNNLDYNSLESLFLNSIFIPGVNSLTSRDSDHFIVTKEGDNVLLSLDNSKKLGYTFKTSSLDGLLTQSDIYIKGSQYKLQWRYNKFKPFLNGVFPSNMNVNIDGIDKKLSLEIYLTKLTNNSDWEVTTDISQRYQEVGLSDILKMLSK